MVSIDLVRAVLCANCSRITDATGHTCPACACEGQMLSLARVLNPNSRIGRITYIYAGDDDDKSIAEC